MSQTINPNGTIPDPTRDLTVVIEPSEGFQGGRTSFDMPFEPIVAYVGQTVMMNSEGEGTETFVHVFGQSPVPFDILDWNPDTRELRVKLHKGAFGT